MSRIQIKRTAAATVALTTVLGVAAAASFPSSSSTATAAEEQPPQTTPRCITREEFRRVKVGQTRGRVQLIVGNDGRYAYSVDGVTRAYKHCANKRSAMITFKDRKVVRKAWDPPQAVEP